jgi:endo-1,4-beta-D-glucanase Y
MPERMAAIAPLVLALACGHSSIGPDTDDARGGSTSSSAGAVGQGGATNSAGGTTSAGASTVAGSVSGGQTQGGSSAGGSMMGGAPAQGGTSSVAGAAGTGTGGQGEPAGVVGAPFKFPQNYRSQYCTYPTLVKSSWAQSAYMRWKSELVTSDGAGGFRRVRRPNNEMDTTVSEGIGYGMILSVVMDDQPLFDDLWNYSQQYLNQNGLMNWLVDSGGKIGMNGNGAATDADEDMAWALALADKKWGGKGSLNSDYLTLAKAQIGRIWDHEVDHGRGELLLAGDSWGWQVPYNPSYFAPNQYRLFAKVSGNDGWNEVIDKGYEMLGKVQSSEWGNASNGLVPAWTNDAGVPTPAFDGAPTNFQYDAIRTPFRIAQDYCDFGEPRAKAYLQKVSTFFSGIGAAKIVDGYELNGTPKPENPTVQAALFVGAPGVASMSDATYSVFLNDTYGLLTTKEMLPPSYYFNLSWQVFSLLMMSGNLFDYTLH